MTDSKRVTRTRDLIAAILHREMFDGRPESGVYDLSAVKLADTIMAALDAFPPPSSGDVDAEWEAAYEIMREMPGVDEAVFALTQHRRFIEAAIRAESVTSPASGDVDAARRAVLAATDGYVQVRDLLDAFEAAIRAEPGLDVERLARKAQEVLFGHRADGERCSECSMLWPCHAFLLACAILRARLTEAER